MCIPANEYEELTALEAAVRKSVLRGRSLDREAMAALLGRLAHIRLLAQIPPGDSEGTCIECGSPSAAHFGDCVMG